MRRMKLTAVAAALQTTAIQADLRSILLPDNQHPIGTQVVATVSLVDAGTQGLLSAPAGLVLVPSKLAYLDAIGGLADKNGWLQYGSRSNGGFFMNVVATVPGGGAIEKIKAQVADCNKGSMVLQSKVTGAFSLTERSATALAGASTYALTQSVSFPPAANQEQQSALQSYGFSDVEQCKSEAAFAGTGELLIWTLEPDAGLADQMTATLYGRAGEYLAAQ